MSGSEKIIACKKFSYIIRDAELAKEECRLLPFLGDCKRCLCREEYELKDVPELIRKGYHTLVRSVC